MSVKRKAIVPVGRAKPGGPEPSWAAMGAALVFSGVPLRRVV